MRFFGKLIFLIFCSTQIYADVSFRLSKKNILKGEPMIAQFEVRGSTNIRVNKNVISQNGVTAEYTGSEESVSIVNMNMTRKKIVKFRIVTAKTGNLKIPDLVIEVDGREVHSGEEEFSVSNEKYVPKNNWFDFGDDIFEGRFPGIGRRTYSEPEEGDLRVKFQTTRNSLYVGEPVVGYFVLYYKNVVQPFFERNEGKPLNFPYFTANLIEESGVTIKASEEDSEEYTISAYQREAYILTPLKKGVYDLGESEFLVEGSPTSYFSQRPILAEKKRLIVKDLPRPQPEGFLGEVGDYNIRVISNTKNLNAGTPHRIKISITGEGTGTYIRDPLENICSTKNSCNFDISLIGENRNRKFNKLKDGGYGFISEMEFEYSTVPKEKGNIKFPPVSLVIFNPFKEIYETKPIRIPDFSVGDALPVEKEPTTPETNYLGYYIYGLLFLSGVFLVYRFREILPSPVFIVKKILSGMGTIILAFLPAEKRKMILSRIPISPVDSDGRALDTMIGNKKDSLLKNFLIQKGLNREEAEFLSKLKSSHGNKNFSEILPILDEPIRQKILTIKQKLRGEKK